MSNFPHDSMNIWHGPYIPNYRPRPPGCVDQRFMSQYGKQNYHCESQDFASRSYQPQIPSSFSKFNPGSDWQFCRDGGSSNRGNFRPAYTGRRYDVRGKNNNTLSRNFSAKEKVFDFRCNICDVGFKTTKELDAHNNTHQKCRVDGCTYTAAPKLVKLHYDMQHRTGVAKKIWNLESKEDIEKWRQERKNNYPTKSNIERKLREHAERVERGEVVETERFGKMRGKGRNRGCGERGRGHRGRGRGGGGRGHGDRGMGRGPGRGGRGASQQRSHGDIQFTRDMCIDKLSESAGSSESVQPIVDSNSFIDDPRGQKRKFDNGNMDDNHCKATLSTHIDAKGIAESKTDEAASPKKKMHVTDRSLPAPDLPVAEKQTKLPPDAEKKMAINNIDPLSVLLDDAQLSDGSDEAVVPETDSTKRSIVSGNSSTGGALGVLACAYGSSDENSDAEDDNDDTQSRPNQVDAQRNKLERSEGTLYSPSTHDEATEIHRAEATAGCSENADGEAMIEENCVANVRERNNNKHGRPQHQKQFNRVQKQRPSLLQKLLANEIRHERNVVMQCIRYIVKKDFFDVQQVKDESENDMPQSLSVQSPDQVKLSQ